MPPTWGQIKRILIEQGLKPEQIMKFKKTKIMNNLEQIKAGAKMGYSAMFTLNTKNTDYPFYSGKKLNYTVIGFGKRGKESIVLLKLKRKGEIIPHEWVFDSAKKHDKRIKITGWLYVGQLFGENKIEEGQKFRVKETGEIGKFVNYCVNSGIPYLRGFDKDRPDYEEAFKQSEIEPVFE
jgi:hypothetical protein